MKAHLVLMVAAAVLMGGGVVATAGFVEDFEGPGPFDIGAFQYGGGAPSAGLSAPGEPALGNTSVKFDLGGDTNNYARVQVMTGASVLSNTTGSFDYYVQPGSQANLAPYMMFIIDGNDNGIYDYGPTGDALVIAFITGGDPVQQGAWYSTGMDAGTTVHVVGNRTGLASNEFNANSNDALPLSDLFTRNFDGSRTWGDLNVIGVRAAAGLWPNGSAYTAFVDNVGVSVVPLPAAALLGAMGCATMGILRRRLG